MVKATELQLKELKSGPSILPTKSSRYIAIQHMYFTSLSGLYCSLLAQMRVKIQQIMSSCKAKSGYHLLGNTKELELHEIITGFYMEQYRTLNN